MNDSTAWKALLAKGEIIPEQRDQNFESRVQRSATVNTPPCSKLPLTTQSQASGVLVSCLHCRADQPWYDVAVILGMVCRISPRITHNDSKAF